MANFKLTQTGEQIQADLDLLDSNSATQGQVLTANGTGGASWQNASGGTQLYRHEIAIGSGSTSNFLVGHAVFYNKDNTVINTVELLRIAILNGDVISNHPLVGTVKISNFLYNLSRLYAHSSGIGYYYVTETKEAYILMTSESINDRVTPL